MEFHWQLLNNSVAVYFTNKIPLKVEKFPKKGVVDVVDVAVLPQVVDDLAISEAVKNRDYESLDPAQATGKGDVQPVHAVFFLVPGVVDQ